MAKISPMVAREVLYMFGYPEIGCRPGSFTESLITAFATADSLNFQKLSTVFPDYGNAISLIKKEFSGKKILVEISQGKDL